MALTFAEQLIQLANAIDVVDEQGFLRIRKLVDDYTQDTLKISVTRFMVESQVGDGNGLIPLGLARKGIYQSRPIKDANGNYGGQSSFVFDCDKPAWIISADTKRPELIDCDHYLDRWSNLKDIPKYQPTTGESVKTSIIIPLKNDDNRTFGVLNFETIERLDISENAKEELLNIAKALAITYSNKCIGKLKSERTHAAFHTLERILSKPLPKLTKPNCFLASSHRAKQDVIQEILNVFSEPEFRDCMNVVFWKNMNKPGNINQALLNVLGTCRYGVCYLSELTKGTEYPFRDNPNVIFEAGMLHGRSDTDSKAPASWVPIREVDSPPAPFDFAGERMILVPRTKSGRLNKKKFTDLFRHGLQGLGTKPYDAPAKNNWPAQFIDMANNNVHAEHLRGQFQGKGLFTTAN